MVKTNEISETESSSHSSQSFEKSGNIDFQVENGQNSSSEEKKFENHRDLNSSKQISEPLKLQCNYIYVRTRANIRDTDHFSQIVK